MKVQGKKGSSKGLFLETFRSLEKTSSSGIDPGFLEQTSLVSTPATKPLYKEVREKLSERWRAVERKSIMVGASSLILCKATGAVFARIKCMKIF